MSSKLIEIFNNCYKKYLDNTHIDLNYLYDSFIKQYFIEIICNKTYEYNLNLYNKNILKKDHFIRLASNWRYDYGFYFFLKANRP
jgi:hypothetical protein